MAICFVGQSAPPAKQRAANEFHKSSPPAPPRRFAVTTHAPWSICTDASLEKTSPVASAGPRRYNSPSFAPGNTVCPGCKPEPPSPFSVVSSLVASSGTAFSSSTGVSSFCSSGSTVDGARRDSPTPPVGLAKVVEVCSPAIVVVVVSSIASCSTMFSTGRISTAPVRPISASASSWFLTPGKFTTTVLPCRMISGSATPMESTRRRITSTAASSAPSSNSPMGVNVTDAPP